ncbi:MAG: GerMN domain-containing protein [bacterium]
MKKIVLACAVVAVVILAVAVARWSLRKPAGPEQAPEPENLRVVTLYFGSRDGSSLVPEEREIKATGAVLEDLRRVVEALIAGPAGGAGAGLFPADVSVRGVYINGKTAYIDFSRQIVDNFAGGSAAEYLLVASIVETVCADFPEVDSVALLVDGEQVETIGGHLDVSKALRARDWR